MKGFIVKKVFYISYAHRLFQYNGKCENLHGHNAKIEVLIQSKRLNKQDMVEDFIRIKDVVGKWLDDNLDHSTILHRYDPLVKDLLKHRQKLFLLNQNPTAEVIANVIKDAIKRLKLNVKGVRVWETPSSMAEIWEE